MATETFRTSLHGFNRTDVVQFIQKMTTAHEKELRLREEENDRMRQELDTLRDEAAQLRAQNEALTAQVKELLQAAPEPLEHPASEPQAAAPAADIAEKELAAYRRAEGMERKARERAEATTRLLKNVFAKANERLNVGSKEFSSAAETLRADYERLQQLLADAKGVFDASAEELQSAGDALDEA